MKKQMRYGIVGGLLLLSSFKMSAMSPTPNLFPASSGMTGSVKGAQVNVRKYPDTQSRIMTRMDESNIRVIGQNEEWYQVRVNQEEGWIHKKYIDLDYDHLIPYKKVLGEEIVDYGLQFLGTPYVWGGSNLLKGVDCSGFTQEVYKAFGVDISRVSYMQATDGETVSKQALRTGDLVFFDTEGTNNGSISHVGIYMDNNRFVHSDGTNGVMISQLTSPYYSRNYVKGVRVLEY